MVAEVLAVKARLGFSLDLPGIVALLIGILILIFPRFLNYLVAAYLIIVGLIAVFNINI